MDDTKMTWDELAKENTKLKAEIKELNANACGLEGTADLWESRANICEAKTDECQASHRRTLAKMTELRDRFDEYCGVLVHCYRYFQGEKPGPTLQLVQRELAELMEEMGIAGSAGNVDDNAVGFDLFRRHVVQADVLIRDHRGISVKPECTAPRNNIDNTDGEHMNNLSASEALFGFCAWLTTREEVMSMGSDNDCAQACEAINLFCDVNKLAEPRDGWEKNLTHPVENIDHDPDGD